MGYRIDPILCDHDGWNDEIVAPDGEVVCALCGTPRNAEDSTWKKTTKRIVITTDADWLPDILHAVADQIVEGFTSGHFDSSNYWNVEE